MKQENHIEHNRVVPSETEFLTPIETIIENTLKQRSPPAPSKVNTLESIEEESNINSIIFIFVFLLIILLIAALIYIYMMHNNSA